MAGEPFPEARYLTRDQLRTLARHGWRGDQTDRLLVITLLRHGFTQPQIVQAYRDAHHARAGRGRILRAVRYRALDLPDRQLAECLASSRSLTDWYNQEHLGGRGLRNGGWFLTSLGILSALVGASIIAWDFWPRPCRSTSEDGCMGSELQGLMSALFGIPFLTGGLLELTAGIPMVIVGNARLGRWVKGDALDRASEQELDRYRAAGPRRSSREPAYLVQPTFSRGGAGLAIQLRF